MRRALGVILLAGSLAFLGIALAKTYHRLPHGGLHIRPAYAIAAVCIVALANSLWALLWRAILRALGVELPALESVRILSLSQLGKYLPGGFWQPLGWVGLARRSGVPAAAALVSSAASLVLILAGGLAIGPILLIMSGAAGHFVWLLLLVPFVILSLHPAVLQRVLSLLARVTKRESVPEVALPLPAIVKAFVATAPMWLLFGFAFAVASAGVGLGSLGDWLLLSGSFAVAWSIGLLAIPVPGGLGIREGVLTLLLGSHFGTAAALTIGIVFRLVSVVAEGAMTLVALSIPQRAASVPGEAVAPGPHGDVA